mgnify:CR=1 FL=1
MKEIIKHLFGLCGESHINIYTFILLILILKYAIHSLGRSFHKTK